MNLPRIPKPVAAWKAWEVRPATNPPGEERQRVGAGAQAARTGQSLSRRPGEAEGGGHSHRRLRKSAGLRVLRGCAGLSYLPQRPWRLRDWGRGQRRPETPSLALLRLRGGGIHFLRRGPQWPVLGLGLCHRPPGARKLPSLKGKKRASGRSWIAAVPRRETRGGPGSWWEGPTVEGRLKAGTGFEKVAAMSLPENECPLPRALEMDRRRRELGRETDCGVRSIQSPRRQGGKGKRLLTRTGSALRREQQTDQTTPTGNQAQ